MDVIFVDCSIFDLKTKIIVNSANNYYGPATSDQELSVDSQVFLYGGQSIYSERKKYGKLNVAECVVTNSGKLKQSGIEKIAHVRSPNCNSNEQSIYRSLSALASCYYNVLLKLQQQGFRNTEVGFPLIGTGVNGFLPELSLISLLRGFNGFAQDYPGSNFKIIVALKSSMLFYDFLQIFPKMSLSKTYISYTSCLKIYYGHVLSVGSKLKPEISKSLLSSFGRINGIENVTKKKNEAFYQKKNGKDLKQIASEIKNGIIPISANYIVIKSEKYHEDDTLNVRYQKLLYQHQQNASYTQEYCQSEITKRANLAERTIKNCRYGHQNSWLKNGKEPSTPYISTIFGLCYGLQLSWDESKGLIKCAGINLDKMETNECVSFIIDDIKRGNTHKKRFSSYSPQFEINEKIWNWSRKNGKYYDLVFVGNYMKKK